MYYIPFQKKNNLLIDIKILIFLKGTHSSKFIIPKYVQEFQYLKKLNYIKIIDCLKKTKIFSLTIN